MLESQALPNTPDSHGEPGCPDPLSRVQDNVILSEMLRPKRQARRVRPGGRRGPGSQGTASSITEPQPDGRQRGLSCIPRSGQVATGTLQRWVITNYFHVLHLI